MKYSMMATTVTGLEDVASKEVSVLLGVEARPDRSRIFFETDLEGIYLANLRCRCIHRLFILVHRGEAKSLDDIYEQVRGLSLADYISPQSSFAIRAQRHGEHPFTSLDIAAIAGKAVIEAYLREKGVRLRVNLRNPDVEVYVLLRNSELLVGVNTTGESLHKRGYRVYDHPAAIKTTIASAMILLSEWRSDEVFLDPMCGGATIPIEAALLARKVPHNAFGRSFAFTNLLLHDPEVYAKVCENLRKQVSRDELQIYGVEISPKHVDGARRNASSAGVSDVVRVIEGDATRLEEFLPLSPDKVVVNLPYGIRSSRPKALSKLYTGLLKSLSRFAVSCSLVAITAAAQVFRESAQSVGAEIVEERRVLHGNLEASIFKCFL